MPISNILALLNRKLESNVHTKLSMFSQGEGIEVQSDYTKWRHELSEVTGYRESLLLVKKFMFWKKKSENRFSRDELVSIKLK